MLSTGLGNKNHRQLSNELMPDRIFLMISLFPMTFSLIFYFNLVKFKNSNFYPKIYMVKINSSTLHTEHTAVTSYSTSQKRKKLCDVDNINIKSRTAASMERTKEIQKRTPEKTNQLHCSSPVMGQTTSYKQHWT
jgi:hypothetical protein